MKLRTLSLLAVVAIVVTACGSGGATSAPTTGGSAAPSAAGSAGASSAPSASAGASAGTSPAASGGGAATGTLRVARLADWYNFWHPVEFQTGNQFQWWSTVFNTLVTAKSDSRTIAPGLADTWEASADAKTYTFKLNPDAKWHDGTDFTADDVIYTATWFAQNAEAYKGFLPAWGQIQGAAEAKGTTNAVPGITAPDADTIKIVLAAPNAEFLFNLTDMANVILPKHALGDATAANVEQIDFTLGKPGVTIGTGPYKLTAFTPDQFVEVTANPDYFRGAPQINQIVFKLFADTALAVAQLESGDLDLAFRVAPGEFDRLAAVDTLNVISAKNPGIVRIVFNLRDAPWSAKEVRQAFYHAINRQAIVDEFYKGRATVLYNPPGFKVYDDLNKYEFSVDKAKELLTAGGYSGQTFRLLYNQTFPDASQIMPLIQADLEAAGVKVELMPTESAAFLENYNDPTKWDGFIAVGGSEALSPQRSRQYFPPTGATESGYTNPRIYELWDTAKSTTDPAAQDAAYHELAKILNEDVPQANLYAPDLVMVAVKRLGGGFDVHLNERESFMDVETWTLQ